MRGPVRALIAALVTGGILWLIIASLVLAGPPWSLMLAGVAVVLGALWLAAVLVQRP